MLTMDIGKQQVIERFFAKIEERYKQLKISEINPQLETYLKHDVLLNIYKKLLDERETIGNSLLKFQNAKLTTLAHRISKSSYTSRTINIVEDINGELCLIIETKRKNKYDYKVPYIPVFSGGSRKAKPCWRIDLPTPEEWINNIAYGTSDVESAIEDTKYSQMLFKKAHELNTDSDLPNPINYSLLGVPFNSTSKNGQLQISLYSPRACFTLYKAVQMINAPKLLENDIIRMIKGVLLTLLVLQDLNLTYEDMHDSNCLIFKNSNGYFLKLTDFESVGPVGMKKCLGSYQFASPEIFAAYSQPSSQHHSYYHKDINRCHGLYHFENSKVTLLENEQKFASSDFANDMWAAGIIILEILNFKKPSSFSYASIEHHTHPLIKGLLQPLRQNRMKLAQAIEVFNKHYNETVPLALPTPSDTQMETDVELIIDCTEKMQEINIQSPAKRPASPILHAYHSHNAPPPSVQTIDIQTPPRSSLFSMNN